MVKKIVEHLLSDMSGDEIDNGGGTVTFVVQGAAYEIDLTASEKSDFEGVLADYVAAARRTSHRTVKSGGSARKDVSHIRSWAADNGITISARGRIPSSVLDAYNEANRS